MNQGMTKIISANTCNTGKTMIIGIVAMHFAAYFVMPIARAILLRKQQIVQAHNAHNAAQK